MSSSEGTKASLTSLDRLHLYLTNSELKQQWNQPLPVAVLGVIIIITAQLLLATSFTASRNSRIRFTKAPGLITSMSESMISAFTVLQRAQSFAYGLACHTSGGSCERPLMGSSPYIGCQGQLPRCGERKIFWRLFKNFSLFKNISGTTGYLGTLISALHQNTKQFYMQVVHTSFSIQLPHHFPGYSVEKGFSKI